MTTLELNMACRSRYRSKISAYLFEWLSWCGLTDDEEAIAHDMLQESGMNAMLEWIEDIEDTKREKWKDVPSWEELYILYTSDEKRRRGFAFVSRVESKFTLYFADAGFPQRFYPGVLLKEL